MAEKQSKLLNVKPLYLIAGPVLFIIISAALATLGLIFKDQAVFAELLVACLLWLMPLCSLVSALVGIKTLKVLKLNNLAYKKIQFVTILDFICIVLPIALVLLASLLL